MAILKRTLFEPQLNVKFQFKQFSFCIAPASARPPLICILNAKIFLSFFLVPKQTWAREREREKCEHANLSENMVGVCVKHCVLVPFNLLWIIQPIYIGERATSVCFYLTSSVYSGVPKCMCLCECVCVCESASAWMFVLSVVLSRSHNSYSHFSVKSELNRESKRIRESM